MSERPDLEAQQYMTGSVLGATARYALDLEARLRVIVRYLNRDIEGQIEDDPDWPGGRADELPRAALSGEGSSEPLCGHVHAATYAACLLRKGHDGPHRNTQGSWHNDDEGSDGG